MKDFILNLFSGSTLASSKRFLLILFGIVLCVICIKAAWEKEYVISITTLAGLIVTLAEMNRRENKLKINNENENGKAQN